MAFITDTRNGGSFFARVSGFFSDLRGSISDWRDYQSTLHELEKLSDRELDDLGISRYDIDRIAWQAVYGK